MHYRTSAGVAVLAALGTSSGSAEAAAGVADRGKTSPQHETALDLAGPRLALGADVGALMSYASGSRRVGVAARASLPPRVSVGPGPP